jgi:uncharacterized protein YbaA (DUF1428 family)
MGYVDGFVLAVPTAGKGAYRAFSEQAWGWFKERGALTMMEAWGDDVPPGEVTSFDMAVRRRDDETVVFAWVTWPDKATRDAAHAGDPDPAMGEMPFDGRRMIYGGFVPLVQR